MRIDSFQPSQNTGDAQEVRRQQQPSQTNGTSTLAQDKASISSQSLSRSTSTPDIRQERVASIKQAMEAGTHNVSNSQLAGAMFAEFFNR